MTIKINGDNTVANPGFSGADDDTGLQVGTDELKLVTSGTERATVTSTGNLGVGINTPGAKLEVSGNGDLSGDAYKYLYSTDGGIKVTGNESTIDILSTANGNHAGSLIIRGNNKGFGFVHDANSDILEVNSFTANADGWHIHSAGSNIDALQQIIGFRKAGGITFNGDTAANNALDDYDQGTWNPTVAFGGSSAGVSYSEREGLYVKIGNLVWASMVVHLSSNGTGTGTITISLPFAVGPNTENRGTGNLSYFASFAGLNSNPNIYASGAGQTVCRFQHLNDHDGTGTQVTNLTHGNVTNSATWRASIMYTTF